MSKFLKLGFGPVNGRKRKLDDLLCRPVGVGFTERNSKKAKPQKTRKSNEWRESEKCTANVKYFSAIGKYFFDEENKETLKIINVFQNSKYPNVFFFGYIQADDADNLANMDYSTCEEIMEERNGFVLQK
jgi:hypothetical protein